MDQLALLGAFSSIVLAVFFVIFVISALLLIAVILLQEGKGGGFGDAFGGAGSETFGPRVGGVNKFTASLAAVFLGSLIGIHLIQRPVRETAPAGTSAQSPVVAPEPGTGTSPDLDSQPFPGPGTTPPPAQPISPRELAERNLGFLRPAEGTTVETPPSGGSAGTGAAVDPWSDPSWGLDPREGSLRTPTPSGPEGVPAPAESPAPGEAGAGEGGSESGGSGGADGDGPQRP